MHMKLDLAQMKALTSPVRRDILGVLGRRGESTAVEIAGALGVSPASLYYHLRTLEAAGLIEGSGPHPATTRPVRTFVRTFERLAVGGAPEDGTEAYRTARVALHDADLRELSRRIRSALIDEPGEDTLRGNDPMMMLRSGLRLSPEGARKVDEAMAEVLRIAARNEDPDGEFQAILAVRVPSRDRSGGDPGAGKRGT